MNRLMWIAIGLVIGMFVVGQTLAGAGVKKSPLPDPPLKPGAPIEQMAKASSPLTSMAVVELFTSEGCSSCPPADDLLLKVEADAKARGREIIPLSYHVDYWDRLGWADPFAQRAFTKRQRDYARTFDWGTYTPQVVIGGQVNMVGSQARRVWAGVDKALQGKFNTAVDLGGTWSGDRQRLEVRYDIRPEWVGPLILNIAVAEAERSVSVERGENKGRRLSHGNVVRVLKEIEMTGPKAGTLSIELPKDWASPGLLLAAYAQDPASKAILGAQALRFDSGLK